MTAQTKIIFHFDLQNFLSPAYRSGLASVDPGRKASIKDIVESLGLPHTEVGCIISLGRHLTFDHIPGPGEIIHIQPHTPPVDCRQKTLLQARALKEHRFIVDVNVGKLASLLRMLGLDTAYNPKWGDAQIAELAWQEGRIVLSRDKGLLKRKKIEYGRLLRNHQPLQQLKEVLQFYGLQNGFSMFTRCLRCNSKLQPVPKESIQHLLLPKTRKYYDYFCICPDCERIYWQGSHLQRMQHLLQGLQLGSKAF